MKAAEANQKINTMADVLGATIHEVKVGYDKMFWFGLRNLDWEKAIKASPERYKGVVPYHAYAKKVFSHYFTNVIKRSNPDAQIGTIKDAYGKVLQWLVNNERKGLLMLGDCGTGKTAIATAIQEVMADGRAMWYDVDTDTFRPQEKLFKWFNATDLMDSDALDEALAYRMVIVDDIGTEPETSISYGQRRNPIPELVDNAEKKRNLLVLTSNLSGDQLREKYGERTIDRLNAICKTVQFRGQSFRS